MNIQIAPAQFRPVTLTLETQDDLDMLRAIVGNVAENRVQHAPSIITAAKVVQRLLNNSEIA